MKTVGKDIVIVKAPVISEKYRKESEHPEFASGPEEVMKIWKNPGYEVLDLSRIMGNEDLVIGKENYAKFVEFYNGLYRNKKIPVTIGGDHGITVPPALSASNVYGDINYVRFDTDLDALSYGSENPLIDYKYSNLDEFNFHALLNELKNSSFLHIGGPIGENYCSGYILRESLGDCIANSIKRIKGSGKDAIFLTEQNKSDHEKLLEDFVERNKSKPAYVSVDTDFFGDVKAHEHGYTPLVGTGDMETFNRYFSKLSKLNKIGMDVAEISGNYKHRASAEFASYVLDTMLPTTIKQNS